MLLMHEHVQTQIQTPTCVLPCSYGPFVDNA